jgi:hypothetical protein
MATHHSSNRDIPESISFLMLLQELQRRSTSGGGFHLERELLWEELVEREHNLEQRILSQLDSSYQTKPSWWQRLRRSVMLKMNRFVSAFNPKQVIVAASDEPQHNQL